MASFQQVKEYVTGVLQGWFLNKEMLDKFSEHNGVVMHDGNILNPPGHTQGHNDTPVGTVIAFMGNTPPEHYLACNGQVLNIADYMELAQFFKTYLGSINAFGGDGTTTFAVPDLRGEFLRGTGTATRNTGSGGNVGNHQDATAHLWLDTDMNNISYNLSYSRPVNVDRSINTTITRKYSGAATYGQLQGQPTVYTSRPTNTSVLYCIKYETVYPISYLDESVEDLISEPFKFNIVSDGRTTISTPIQLLHDIRDYTKIALTVKMFWQDGDGNLLTNDFYVSDLVDADGNFITKWISFSMTFGKDDVASCAMYFVLNGASTTTSLYLDTIDSYKAGYIKGELYIKGVKKHIHGGTGTTTENPLTEQEKTEIISYILAPTESEANPV